MAQWVDMHEDSNPALTKFWRHLRETTLNGPRWAIPEGPEGDPYRELAQQARQHHWVKLVDDDGEPIAYVISWEHWTARWPEP